MPKAPQENNPFRKALLDASAKPAAKPPAPKSEASLGQALGIFGVGVTALVLMILLVAKTGDGNKDSPSAARSERATTHDRSLGAMMASLDLGLPVEGDLPLVATYRRTLATLARKCTERPSKIADEIENSVGIFKQRGYPTSRLKVMQLTNRAVPRSAAPQRCSDIMAGIIVLTVTNP